MPMTSPTVITGFAKGVAGRSAAGVGRGGYEPASVDGCGWVTNSRKRQRGWVLVTMETTAIATKQQGPAMRLIIFYLFLFFFCTADLITAVEFDPTGDYLATGDRGGRVVLFERNDDASPLSTAHPTEFLTAPFI